MSDKERGIYQKYNVTRTDGSSGPGGKHEHCHYWVLDLNHDKHAIAAYRAYAESCAEEYPVLASDILLHLEALVSNEKERIKKLVDRMMTEGA